MQNTMSLLATSLTSPYTTTLPSLPYPKSFFSRMFSNLTVKLTQSRAELM